MTTHTLRRTLTISVLAVAASAAGLMASPTAQAATPLPFASVNEPIGIASAPDRLLLTRPVYSNPHEVLSIDSAGVSSVFATLPASTGFTEDYIAVSPGLGGFDANDVFVTHGSTIFRIPPGGSPVTTFATIPSLGFGSTGITFDHYGSFGSKMIVTGTSVGRAEIWTVDASGTETLVNTIFTGAISLEGPDVAPPSLPQFAGWLFVASEESGNVYAVSPPPASQVTTVGTWPFAESVHFIPPTPCSFGTSGGAFFTTLFEANGGSVYKFPPSDFAGLAGDLLVTSEGGAGIGLFHFTPTTVIPVTPSPFQTNLGLPHEGSAFVDCAVPPVVTPAESVTICKQTNPAGGTGFTFALTFLAGEGRFTLNDNDCSTTGLGPSSDPSSGPYSFEEFQQPPGWQLVDIVCTGGADILIGLNNVFDPGDTGVEINLGPGEHVTCTFFNANPPSCIANTEDTSLGISTGTGSTGSPDPIWTVNSGSAFPAYPRDLEPPWVKPPFGSAWIHASNTAESDPQPLKTYVYKTLFSVPSSVQSLTLTFQYAADNNVSFDLTGPFPIVSGPMLAFAGVGGVLVANFQTLHPTPTPGFGTPTITLQRPATLGTGIYTLTATVGNPDAPSPSGLLVSGTVHCRPDVVKIPEGNANNVGPGPSANLWLCQPNFAPYHLNAGVSYNAAQPLETCAGPGEGDLLVIEHAVDVATDPLNMVAGLGAYEFSVEYDNFVIQSVNPCDVAFQGVGNVVAALPGGAGAARGDIDQLNSSKCPNDPNSAVKGTCTMSAILENIIHFGCVTFGTTAAGPLGDMDLAALDLIPHPDLANDICPCNENGVRTIVKDNGCELVDIFGHPVLGSVNGGLTPSCGDLAVTVRILEGDLNLDCQVNAQDQQLIAYRYNSFFGVSLYSKWFDLEPALHDLDIDIKDLQKVFGRDGSTCQDPIPAQPPLPPPAPFGP